MRTHQHTNDTKTAIGYVRVSTQEQATEWVSLDAQRDRLRAYCRLHAITLIDIKADEGISGSTLERPGLQAALQMLRRGRANTLAGMISERTRDALQHMKAQGVRLGPAPYGYELSHECDDKGRRLLVPLAHEQEVLRKVESLRADGLSLRDIARRLNEANLSARRDGTWRPQRISIVLQRSGKHTVRPTQKPGPRIPLRYDREAATARAMELRVQGLSLNKIGLLLRKEQLTPLRGAPQSDREAAVRRASKLRAQGMHLREIGVRLAVEGVLPKEGGHLAAVFRACPAGEPRATCPGWMTARRNARGGAARPRPSPHRRPRKSASPLDSVALV